MPSVQTTRLIAYSCGLALISSGSAVKPRAPTLMPSTMLVVPRVLSPRAFSSSDSLPAGVHAVHGATAALNRHDHAHKVRRRQRGDVRAHGVLDDVEQRGVRTLASSLVIVAAGERHPGRGSARRSSARRAWPLVCGGVMVAIVKCLALQLSFIAGVGSRRWVALLPVSAGGAAVTSLSETSTEADAIFSCAITSRGGRLCVQVS